MKRRAFILGGCSCCGALSKPALAWDPIGDITHPDRIVRNTVNAFSKGGQDAVNTANKARQDAVNAVGQAGQTIDQWRRELDANGGAFALQGWIVASRNNARASSNPIPPDIAQTMNAFGYGPEITGLVSYRIGSGNDLNLANAAIHCGNAAAITLIDTICFADIQSAQDLSIWAHELWHVTQYLSWGLWNFSVSYLRDYQSVEGDAYAAQSRFGPWYNTALAMAEQQQIQQQQQQQQVTGICVTPVVNCNVPPAPSGTPCVCSGPFGWVSGSHP